MTKTQRTMMELCLKECNTIGPRTISGTLYGGWYLTMGEIRRIYIEQGFNATPGRRTIPKHLEAWETIGVAEIDGDTSKDDCIVWFNENSMLLSPTASAIRMERAGIAYAHVMEG